MAAKQTGSTERVAIVADDSPIIRDNVRSALGAAWRVFVAANGVEAVAFARTMLAQLIVLDVRMPRMDGVDACAHIRKLQGYAAVPVVMLTAYDDPQIRQRARRAGATAVFAKPFTFESLRAGIAALFTGNLDALSPAALIERPSPDGAGGIGDREALEVCRRMEAAAKPDPYISFAEAMDALREADRR